MSEVKYVIFCDDVRQEIAGKYFIIGMYTNNINVPGPVTSVFVLAACGIKFDSGIHKFSLRAKFEEQVCGHIEATAETSPNAEVVLAYLPIQVMGVRKPGPIDVEAKLSEDATWEHVASIPITVADPRLETVPLS